MSKAANKVEIRQIVNSSTPDPVLRIRRGMRKLMESTEKNYFEP